MRNYLVLFVLFTGVILMSCSEEVKSGDSKEIEVAIPEIEENEVESEDESEDEQNQTAVLTWESYHNQRFDFCVGYPSNFLKPLGEPENRDGNIFANANGSSEMRASGTYNALEQTIAEAFESATENGRYYDPERIVTYKRQKDNWFVVSGNYNESIFYVKTILVDYTYYTLYFEYHSSEEAKFKEIIKVTTKDFPKC